MNQWHECRGEEEQWARVYKPTDEQVLRTDSGNIPINYCPYCGMKLIETEESVNVSKFVKFEEELYINIDKIIAVRRANSPFGNRNIVIVTENEGNIVLKTEDLGSVIALIN